MDRLWVYVGTSTGGKSKGIYRFRFDPEILARCTPRQLRLLGDHAQSSYD